MSLPLLVSLCIVSSAFGVIVQAEAQLVPLHSTPGKGSAELSRSLEGHQETPRCHLSCGWAGVGVLTLLRRTPVLTLNASTPFYLLKKCATFPDFFWKRAFQGNIGPTKSFQRLQLWAVLAEAREGKDRCFLPVSPTSLAKGRSPSACWNFSSWFIYSEIKLSNAFEWTNPENHPLIFVTVLFFSFLNNVIYSHYRCLWELIWMRVLCWLAGLLSFIFFHSWQICEGC